MNEIDEMYRAPREHVVAVPTQFGGAPHKWIYAGLTAAGHALLLFAGTKLSLLQGLASLLVISANITGMTWLYGAWRDAQQGRGGRMLGATSPGGAMVGFFVPFYNLYWIFAVHQRLAQAIDEDLRVHKLQIGSEPSWAYAANVVMIVANVAQFALGILPGRVCFALSAVLWFVYMSRVDTFRRMLALAERAEAEGSTER